MFSEIRYAIRALARNPGFAAVAILTLALGIGANTAIFTVFDGVLLKALPYADANRLVAVQEVFPRFARFGPSLPVTACHFREWRKHNHSFEDMALVATNQFTLSVNGEPQRVLAGRVSASFFPVLGIRPALGRTFTEDEDRPGRDHVVVLSDALWARAFHRDPGVVGSKIVLDSAPYEVVGVLPPGIRVPTQGNLLSSDFGNAEAELWKPFAIGDSDLAILAEFNYGCLARLKPGVSPAQAVADLNVIQGQIVASQPEKVELRTTVTELLEQMTGSSRSSLTLLLAAAGAVLLIVVVNLANLLLARAGGRRHELAIRAAIGAPLSRLVRQMLVESILLAAAGGVLGALLAKWALAAVVLKAPLNLPGLADVHMDLAAFAFAAVVSLASGILFGALPAWRLARTDPQEALKSGGRSTEGRRSGNVRRVLIASEVAMSTVCLVVGGLLLSSFVHLLHVDKGFQADHTVIVGLGLSTVDYPTGAKATQFVRALLDRVHTLPGVVAAGVSNRSPLSGEGSNLSIDVEGAGLTPSDRPIVDYRCVTPDFFRAIGIPLISGRLIENSDGDHPVAVVSAITARRLWPHESPIGKRVRLGSDFWIDVVGVAGDVRSSLQKNPNMTIYIPFWQRPRWGFALHIRTAMDPMSITAAVRTEIHRLDPGVVVPRFWTIDSIVDASVAQRRFQLTLVLVFALAALLLAAIGVYGIVAQSVAQRTNEIGIRLALGASRSDVWRLVAQHGLSPVIGGLAVGLIGAIVAARLVSGFLFGVKAVDPLTFVGVSLVLLGAAFTACCFPALRATRVDPLTALRYE